MKPVLFLIYAIGGYAAGQASLLYLMGFFIDFAVPKGISQGPTTSVPWAIAINVALVLLFGLHHSITARSSFKRWWTKFVPAPIERATYLYMTAAMTFALVYFWQPIPITVWDIDTTGGMTAMYVAYGMVWTMMLLATFQFGHFGFFGLAQAWENFRKSSPKDPSITVGLLYAVVRHPISLGWMMMAWMAPHLTVGHIVFSAAAFAYILIATPFEEADLIEELGDYYREYRRRTSAFFPWFKGQGNAD